MVIRFRERFVELDHLVEPLHRLLFPVVFHQSYSQKEESLVVLGLGGDVDAEYFDCFEELLAKCRHYLDHEAARERIARRGQQRCVTGRYSNQDRLAPVLEHALRNGAADRAKQRFPAEILPLRWRERQRVLGLA